MFFFEFANLKGTTAEQKIKFLVQLIILDNLSEVFHLQRIWRQVTIISVSDFFITKRHFHSTKLVQDRISKIRNLLSDVPNLMKFVVIAHHNQQQGRLKYFLPDVILFKLTQPSFYVLPFKSLRTLHLPNKRVAFSGGFQ